MKHVGKHDQRKAVLLFKEVPGTDEEMCLIVYTDKLPKLIHDPLMKVIESEVGQNANDITEPLNRTLMDNGQNLLNALHHQGYIRKVPTNQMILTPNASTTIRLDELNKILKEMASGKEATTRLAELDASAGLRDPDKSLANIGSKSPGEALKESAADAPEPISITEMAAAEDGVLTDAHIAQGQLSQANALAADAERLLTEAARIRDEAYTLAPELKPKKTRKARVVKAKTAATPAKRKPGRPRKNATTSTKG